MAVRSGKRGRDRLVVRGQKAQIAESAKAKSRLHRGSRRMRSSNMGEPGGNYLQNEPEGSEGLMMESIAGEVFKVRDV